VLGSCFQFWGPLVYASAFLRCHDLYVWVSSSSHVCSVIFVEHLLEPLRLIEEPNDLTSHVLPPRLFVIHNTSACCQDDVPELSRWQQLDNPLLEISELNIIAGRDDTGLVETAIELNDDFARSVVVNFLEFSDVAVLLHDAQELYDNLRARSDQTLTLAGLLGIVDCLETVVENGGLDHVGGID